MACLYFTFAGVALLWVRCVFSNEVDKSVLPHSLSAGIHDISSMTLLFYYYIASLENDAVMTSQCMQFIFGDKWEVYLLDESALLVTGKESKQEDI